MIDNGLGPWRSRRICRFNIQCSSLLKSFFSFPLVTAKITGDYF